MRSQEVGNEHETVDKKGRPESVIRGLGITVRST